MKEPHVKNYRAYKVLKQKKELKRGLHLKVCGKLEPVQEMAIERVCVDLEKGMVLSDRT